MSQHEFPADLVERVARAQREAWRDLCENRDETVEWEDIDEDEREMRVAEALAALRALRDAGALVPEGWVAVPREPSDALLMSMALRADHGLGCPGYYDVPGGEPWQTHARRLEVALSDARKQHEEVVGSGFYQPEREDYYHAMRAAARAREARDEWKVTMTEVKKDNN